MKNRWSVASTRVWRGRQRDRLIALKLTLRCVDCGWQPTSAAETTALDFDHVDPSTKTRRSSAFYYTSWDQILAEIAKCEPRCARCHRIRTHNERHWETHHNAAAQPDNQMPLFDMEAP